MMPGMMLGGLTPPSDSGSSGGGGGGGTVFQQGLPPNMYSQNCEFFVVYCFE